MASKDTAFQMIGLTAVRLLTSFCATALLCAASMANTIGSPVSVDQNAVVSRGGSQQVLRVGLDVFTGDVIETDRRGQVQLIFQDNTRIAIGPNSRLVIERALFRRSGAAENFVVGTTRGAFRFLSGDSPRNAYAIRTPTATLGIRGTIFDLSVGSARGTDIVLLSGEVRMCAGGGNNCAVLRGTCATANATSAAISAPASQAEQRSLIRGSFPFIMSQANLREDFVAPVAACGVGQTVQVPLERREVRSGGGGGGAPASTDSPGGGAGGGGGTD